MLYPNTLYLRIQQPDQEGFPSNPDPATIWWYDICSVLISNIIDRSAALGPLRGRLLSTGARRGASRPPA